MPEPVFDESRIERLGAMARLDVPASQRPELARRLSGILAAFAALRAVPTEGVESPAWPDLPLREDAPGEVLDPTTVLQNAPRRAAGCFVVPRVVEG